MFAWSKSCMNLTWFFPLTTELLAVLVDLLLGIIINIGFNLFPALWRYIFFSQLVSCPFTSLHHFSCIAPFSLSYHSSICCSIYLIHFTLNVIFTIFHLPFELWGLRTRLFLYFHSYCFSYVFCVLVNQDAFPREQ